MGLPEEYEHMYKSNSTQGFPPDLWVKGTLPHFQMSSFMKFKSLVWILYEGVLG